MEKRSNEIDAETSLIEGPPDISQEGVGKNATTRNEFFFRIELCLLLLLLAGLGFSHWIIVSTNRKNMKQLEELIQTELASQTSLLRTATENAKEQILKRTIQEITTSRRELGDAVGSGTAITGGRIRETNSKVDQLEDVFNTVLEEQKKNTIESLYDDVYLADKMKEALGLMEQGQYRNAHEAFVVIATEQPDNFDARFYRYYSLFLMNKQDRGQYRSIKDGFAVLLRSGYSRQEIDDVLSYITIEENGMIPEGF